MVHRRPLVPEDRNGHRPAMYLQRAAFAHALAATTRHPDDGCTTANNATPLAQKRWGDVVTELVLRGAVAPAMTSVPAWAGVLSQEAVGDFVASLEQMSAGARVLNACPRISLDGLSKVKFPRRDGPTAPITAWVEEGQPIPNLKFNLTQSASLGPPKALKCITSMTRETVESGAGETVSATLLREGISLGLDTKLFSDDAPTAASPAGLLNGIDPLSATAAGDGAMIGDLDKIAAAIAPFTTGLVFVAHPAQASYLRLRRGWAVAADVEMWPTLGVAPGTVIGLDPLALAAGFGPEPEIRSSKEGVIHEEDTTPLPIAMEGSPPVVAAPSRDLFQTDCIATLLILRAAWTWRAAGAIAWVSGASWGG
jgi:hypothetical protein